MDSDPLASLRVWIVELIDERVVERVDARIDERRDELIAEAVDELRTIIAEPVEATT